MNSEEQKVWNSPNITLVVPSIKYEYRMNRHGQLSATHIAHPSNEERTLCGRDIDDWVFYNCSAKSFNTETWYPKKYGIKESDRLCQGCVRKFYSLISEQLK